MMTLRVAVDDAGNGCASLQRLVDVRPEMVKLDRELPLRRAKPARRDNCQFPLASIG